MSTEVCANLILSNDGRGVRDGSSKALSFPADRSRFHQIRKKADLIVIGGNTARNEPYATTPLPLVVITRSAAIPELRNNSMATLVNASIATVLSSLRNNYSAILIEAGPELVQQALSEKLIDTLYLSISEKSGDLDAPRYELSELVKNYQLTEHSAGPGGELRTYTLVAPLP